MSGERKMGRISSWNAGNDDSPNATDDAADEIMDRIVKSATQVPSQRAVPRERKRSRANRKSLRRTLKSGLTPEEAKALGLISTSEMQYQSVANVVPRVLYLHQALRFAAGVRFSTHLLPITCLSICHRNAFLIRMLSFPGLEEGRVDRQDNPGLMEGNTRREAFNKEKTSVKSNGTQNWTNLKAKGNKILVETVIDTEFFSMSLQIATGRLAKILKSATTTDEVKEENKLEAADKMPKSLLEHREASHFKGTEYCGDG
ncbi:hypothetical protein AAES_04014 [Amazona aestiva]|uniref:DAD domain-containing protein n=1 Tax=Amazona aestiva TaxID=12930 RepID=A0A0Q3X9Y8_AMAAE|nr:hypothetical protein AAES_04014 [Amazona aestiva]